MTAAPLRYPPEAVLGDYVRAGAGLALTAGPLALLPVHPWVGGLLAMAAALFALFFLRTLRRHLTRFAVDDECIRAEGPLGTRTVPWRDLARMTLSYYATRRDRRDGWMELRLSGADTALAVESTLDRFDRIAHLAAAAACRNGLVLSPATIDNFAALGISAVERPAAPGDL